MTSSHQHTQKSILTPDQVIELKTLGIVFNDTVNVWELNKYPEPHYALGVAEPSDSMYNNAKFDGLDFLLPAPDLGKLLEKMPKTFNDGTSCYCLIFDYANEVVYYYDAMKSTYPFNCKVSPTFSLCDPLSALYDLILWVATKFPSELNQ